MQQQAFTKPLEGLPPRWCCARAHVWCPLMRAQHPAKREVNPRSRTIQTPLFPMSPFILTAETKQQIPLHLPIQPSTGPSHVLICPLPWGGRGPLSWMILRFSAPPFLPKRYGFFTNKPGPRLHPEQVGQPPENRKTQEHVFLRFFFFCYAGGGRNVAVPVHAKDSISYITSQVAPCGVSWTVTSMAVSLSRI